MGVYLRPESMRNERFVGLIRCVFFPVSEAGLAFGILKYFP